MKIRPELGGGFRDYLPKDMIPRQRMLDTIREVFERFGFAPLDTPGIEKEEILTGGDPDFSMRIFRAGVQSSDKEFALRFDLTVPLARVVSMYHDLGRPFKRYQMGKVWRGERPQAGRFREFMQFDADTVGTDSPLADAEVIALMDATMRALGFENTLVRVNNRKILNGLSEFVGFADEQTPDVLRSLDKMDKISWEGVAGELADNLEFDGNQLDALKQFVELRADNQEETISAIRSLMGDSKVAMEGADELEAIRKYLDSLGVARDKWAIDLSVARGLGYYTGPVFETVLLDLPGIGSVFSGGRYDGLVARFTDQSVPATGASVGVDRIFAAMEQLGLVEQSVSVSKVVVLNFDPVAEPSVLKATSDLRESGIPTELYLGRDTSLKGQLTYAVQKDARVVIIIGGDEQERGVAQVKDLQSRKQSEVPLGEISSAVSDTLGE